MKHLWMYRLSDDDAYFILGEIYLSVPMTETMAVREVKRDLRQVDRKAFLTGTLYRIDMSAGLPASKPTRTFWRSPEGKVHDAAKNPRPAVAARKTVGTYQLLLHRPASRPAVHVLVNGVVFGVVYADGLYGHQLPAEVVTQARALLALGENT